MCNEITFENIDTSFVIEFNASLFLSYKIFTVVLLAFCPQYIIYTRVRNIFWDMVGERKRERAFYQRLTIFKFCCGFVVFCYYFESHLTMKIKKSIKFRENVLR